MIHLLFDSNQFDVVSLLLLIPINITRNESHRMAHYTETLNMYSATELPVGALLAHLHMYTNTQCTFALLQSRTRYRITPSSSYS